MSLANFYYRSLHEDRLSKDNTALVKLALVIILDGCLIALAWLVIHSKLLANLSVVAYHLYLL